MSMKANYLLIAVSAVLLVACGKDGMAPEKPRLQELRWYSAKQVNEGQQIYQDNCAQCHGSDGEGAPNWRKQDPSGKFPAPPLNGSGHAWHHPRELLRMTIRLGGTPLGGSMPPFGGKLNAAEIDSVIAWMQSHWSNETYNAWAKRSARAALSQEK